MNAILLPSIFRISWILFVCEFKPLTVVGFFFYILVFPFLAIGYLVLRVKRLVSEKVAESSVSGAEGGKKKRSRAGRKWPTLTAVGFTLLAWLLVFGDSPSTLISLIGASLSGVFLLTFSKRLFLRSTPQMDGTPRMFWWMELPVKGAEGAVKDIQSKSVVKKAEVDTNITTLRTYRRLLIWFIKLLRGEATKNKATLIVLLEFVSSLIFLAVIAILFWGLVSKATNPALIDLATSLYISMSSFLPGLNAPEISQTVPLWVKVGTSATAWILFVVYLSPAGNLIPEKQKNYLERLLLLKRSYSSTISKVKKEIVTLEQLQKKLSVTGTVAGSTSKTENELL